MTIRRAAEEDVSRIVDLLKLSLGESLIPKSERYWHWKHLENPFGPSPVLVMEDQGLPIGVRAFMQWQWTSEGQIWKALRAVDTATHPDYRGKGIFKKLTMTLVEQCNAEGYNFIFNTPNAQSKPGYLKMGWMEVGKLPVRILPVLNHKHWLGKAKVCQIANEHQFGTSDKWPLWVDQIRLPGTHTPYSSAYLNWRYARVPVADYGRIFDPDQKLAIIFRVKITKGRRELRLAEILSQDPVIPQGELANVLGQLKKAYRPAFLSWSGLQTRISPAMSFIAKQIGPLVTKRNLSMNEESLKTIISFANWKPSLGDLELF